ncbi:MAG: hypothetical protein EDM71_08000 [Proteobacteria bacterium]|nr:MAG: hypothetical protein EDM71_08000 [Pseudomonadota bacterium]MBC6945146.1 hypothetical protein [Gammaproteobacteria bacterium]MCE7897047.1 hypothetical protein [Gammaproteobacteria bacterium PRO8]MCQ3934733.1 hypothetical protein [Gammaproteobacteria bacterium]
MNFFLGQDNMAIHEIRDSRGWNSRAARRDREYTEAGGPMIELPGIVGFEIVKRQGGAAEIAVGPEIGEAEFLRLLRWLPKAHELSFYDQYFQGTPNDPGAYVSVQRQDDLFQYRLANHGWFRDWSYESPEQLAALMALNLGPCPNNPDPLKSVRITAGARLPMAFARR